MSNQLRSKKVPKYRKYSPSKLENAVLMVLNGTMSKKKAANSFGIPRSTLIDKLSGRSKLGDRLGRPTVLTTAEEQILVEYSKLMASIGYPLKKQELTSEVKKVLDNDGRKTPFKDNLPGKDWFRAFCGRHPELAQRNAMPLGHQRACITKEMVDGWFSTLEKFLKQEVPDYIEMLKDPRRSFNADESGFPLCVNTGKVLAPKGAHHVYQVCSSTKQQLTVMTCFNAFGEYVPPLIVYPGERYRDTGIGAFPEAIYGLTSNGWMDSALFVEFLKHLNAFIDTKAIKKPVILYVDGHSTHMSLEASTFCRDQNIVLYCLLPNATHLLQPCDVGLFGPMKSSWRKEVKQWHLEHLGQSFSKKDFPGVFRNTWYNVTKLENAVHAFQRCGLFPLSPSAVDLSKLTPSSVLKKEDAADLREPANSTEPALPVPTPTTQPDSETPLQSNSEAYVNVQSEPTTPKSPIQPHTLSDIHPGPSGAAQTAVSTMPFTPKIVSQSNDRSNFVSPSFSLLTVPEIKSKPQTNAIRNKLPKALSGTDAIKMLQDRETKKRQEEDAKQKRKEDRERKRKEREEEREKKRIEREEKKRQREEKKNEREQQKKKTKKRKNIDTSSSSDSDCDVNFEDTDDDLDEFNRCPGCKTDCSEDEDCIRCTKCPQKWHITCTGDSILYEIPYDQVVNYPYVCEECV